MLKPTLIRTLLLGVALIACPALNACQAQVGDNCQGNADCSQIGDRICDITQPGGYCTQFNCEPGQCPDEAVCVVYSVDVSPLMECVDPQARPRTARTFCMKRCEKDSNCRDEEGYVCTPAADLEGPNLWGARIISDGTKEVWGICQSPLTAELPEDSRETGVCTGESDDLIPDVTDGSLSEGNTSADGGDTDGSAP